MLNAMVDISSCNSIQPNTNATGCEILLYWCNTWSGLSVLVKKKWVGFEFAFKIVKHY